MHDLLQKAQSLQGDARLVLEELSLEKFFQDYGEVKLVGSMTFGLMTWEDIDIDLITEDRPTDQLFWKVVKYLFSLGDMKLLMLADNRSGLKEANRPKSMYLGMKYESKKGTIWKLDIRLIQRSEVKEASKLIESLSDIDEDLKLAILRIKTKLKDNPKYHKEISSVDIYDAVVNKGIGGFAEFSKMYLQ